MEPDFNRKFSDLNIGGADSAESNKSFLKNSPIFLEGVIAKIVFWLAVLSIIASYAFLHLHLDKKLKSELESLIENKEQFQLGTIRQLDAFDKQIIEFRGLVERRDDIKKILKEMNKLASYDVEYETVSITLDSGGLYRVTIDASAKDSSAYYSQVYKLFNSLNALAGGEITSKRIEPASTENIGKFLFTYEKLVSFNTLNI